MALILVLGFCSGCAPSLHDVIGIGDNEQVAAMIRTDPSRVSDTNELGKQPLQYAVSFRNRAAMDLLVDAGADVNAADGTGLTALHVAAMLGLQEEAQWLLDHGADMHQPDHFGDLPSHTAAIYGQGGVIKVLRDAGDPLTGENKAGLTPLDLAQKHRKDRAARYIEKLMGHDGG